MQGRVIWKNLWMCGFCRWRKNWVSYAKSMKLCGKQVKESFGSVGYWKIAKTLGEGSAVGVVLWKQLEQFCTQKVREGYKNKACCQSRKKVERCKENFCGNGIANKIQRDLHRFNYYFELLTFFVVIGWLRLQHSKIITPSCWHNYTNTVAQCPDFPRIFNNWKKSFCEIDTQDKLINAISY